MHGGWRPGHCCGLVSGERELAGFWLVRCSGDGVFSAGLEVVRGVDAEVTGLAGGDDVARLFAFWVTVAHVGGGENHSAAGEARGLQVTFLAPVAFVGAALTEALALLLRPREADPPGEGGPVCRVEFGLVHFHAVRVWRTQNGGPLMKRSEIPLPSAVSRAATMIVFPIGGSGLRFWYIRL